MTATTPGTPSDDDAVHRHRRLAESFGAGAERYDRTRPRYPDTFVDAVAARIPGRTLVDAGIGTGISAEPFRERGFDVLGVEPDDGMAAIARRKGFAVESARFEVWDAAGRTFDGVICGQAWHWVDPQRGAAQAARVLVPGGVVVVFWNSARLSDPLAASFARVFDAAATGLPFNPWRTAVTAQPYARIIDSATAGFDATGAFGQVEHLAFGWHTVMTRDVWLEQASTAGGVNTLPHGALDALLSGLGRVIDASGGQVEVAYTTVAAITRRTGR